MSRGKGEENNCKLPCLCSVTLVETLCLGLNYANTHGDWGEEVMLPVCFGKRSLNDCAKSTPVPSRVGESKVLRHGERACPLGCTSARSRLGPPTTYNHRRNSGLHNLILRDTVRTLLGSGMSCKRAVKSDPDPVMGLRQYKKLVSFHRGLS
jgi:hypothetical protein